MNRRKDTLRCRRIAALLLTGILGTMLTGCKGQSFQLAKEEPALHNGNLCGMLVTWGEQEIEADAENETVELKPSLFGDSGLDVLFETDETVAEGVLTSEGRVLFDGVKGAEFVYYMKETEDGSEYMSTRGSTAYDNVHYSENITDEGEEHSVTADCHVSSRYHDVVYVNPVYVREDGSYYARLHTSAGFLFSENGPGASFGQTLTESTSEDGDMGKQSDSFSVEISLVVTDEVESVLIKEMDGNDNCIRETESGYCPELSVELLEETEYVLVEERTVDGSGEAYIHRISYDRPREGETVYHTSYFCTESQVLEAMTVEFTGK